MRKKQDSVLDRAIEPGTGDAVQVSQGLGTAPPGRSLGSPEDPAHGPADFISGKAMTGVIECGTLEIVAETGGDK